MLDRRGRGRVIIAFGAEQPDDQQLVFLGPRRDHRAVDRLAFRIVERGEIAEAALEPGLLHPLDDERVADPLHRLALRVGRRAGCSPSGSALKLESGGSGSDRAGSPSGVSSTGPGTGGKAGAAGSSGGSGRVETGIERRQRVAELVVGDDRTIVLHRRRRGRGERRRLLSRGRGCGLARAQPPAPR